MRKILVILVALAAHIVPVHGQCDMRIVKDLSATVRLYLPDGESFLLEQGAVPLEQPGEYRLTVSIASTDSLVSSFMLTGEEDSIVTKITLQRERKNLNDWRCRDSITSCHLTITKYSKPSPLVSIRYLYYAIGEHDEFPGPFFTIRNESRDTLYGQWLPGYFWGTVSVWNGKEYVGNLFGNICTSWNSKPPLYPDTEKYAWIASFGRALPVGKYRFNVYYSTKDEQMNTARLVRETDSMRWWCNVQDWHLLTCEFELSAEAINNE